MSKKFDCKKLREELDRLKKLKVQFDLAYTEGLEKVDLSGCKDLYKQMREILNGVDSEISRMKEYFGVLEFRNLKLHEQYERQVEVALKSGLFNRINIKSPEEVAGRLIRKSGKVSKTVSSKIVETENGEEVPVIERDGEIYPMPSWREVSGFLQRNKEIIREKSAQGFTKMLIVPFGSNLMRMAEAFGQKIIELDLDGELDDDKGIFCPDGSLARFDRFSEDFPLSKDMEWKEENLRYYPESYGSERSPLLGMSKQEAVNKFGAWQVCFVEDNVVIPDFGSVVGGRQQIDIQGGCYKNSMEMDKPASFKEVLNRKKRFFKEPEKYEHEVGFTAEQDLWMRLDYLLGGKDSVLLDYKRSFSYEVFLTECFDYLTYEVPSIGFASENGEEIVGIQLNMIDPYEGADNATGRTLVMLK